MPACREGESPSHIETAGEVFEGVEGEQEGEEAECPLLAVLDVHLC
eukprot:CAMPEP_0168391118 /NCGR_PEP_ID=MMETSP0228-20121227/17822_1 /TAXON_ID=133427 /ORGANISM="Protoceratium reticulatum, Strain CCCM 535 (=CCMP 1889)" /LENGTH=45 /DNA_ID= /DNA_START= /DNA_END= /DNA_ORIENTATION=